MDEGYVHPSISILRDNSSILDDIKHKVNKLILSDTIYQLNDLNQDFEKISYLGRGSYGVVTQRKHLESNAYIAMKRVLLKNGRNAKADSKKLITKVLREMVIHEKLNSCPYIIDFYGFFIDENEQNLYIITELMDLTLREFYSNVHELYDRFPEEQICYLTVPLIDGLLHARERDILHRDIKPSNILLNREGEVKLCDFGEATQAAQDLVSTCCGAPAYRPPERCVEENVEYDDRSDVWSLGITLAEALTNGKHYIDKHGNVPVDLFQIIHLIKTTTPEIILSRCSFSSDDCPMKEFLRDCIKELNTRPYINDLQNSSLYGLYSREREKRIQSLTEFVKEILKKICELDEKEETDDLYVTALEGEETNDLYVTALEREETSGLDEKDFETEKTMSTESNTIENDIRNSFDNLKNSEKDQLSTLSHHKNGIVNILPTGSNLNESQNQPSTSNHTSSQLIKENENHTEKKISLTRLGLTMFLMMVLSNELKDNDSKTSKTKTENSSKLQETSSGHTKKIRYLPKVSIRNKKTENVVRELSSVKNVVAGVEDSTFFLSFKDLNEYDINNEESVQKLREIIFQNRCVFHIPKSYDVPDLLNGFIGSGTRSIAIEAEHCNTLNKVAIKRLRFSYYSNFYKKNVSREIKLYKKIQHKNITNLLDTYTVSSSLHDKKFYLIMEFGGFPLRAWILDREKSFNNPTGEKQFKYLLYQLLNGVDYLHQQDIIHGILNPDNIMVDEKFNLKITNLGVGNLLETEDVLIDTIIPNFSYSAPEILCKKYDKSDQGSLLLTAMLKMEKRILANEALKHDYFHERQFLKANF